MKCVPENARLSHSSLESVRVSPHAQRPNKTSTETTFFPQAIREHACCAVSLKTVGRPEISPITHIDAGIPAQSRSSKSRADVRECGPSVSVLSTGGTRIFDLPLTPIFADIARLFEVGIMFRDLYRGLLMVCAELARHVHEFWFHIDRAVVASAGEFSVESKSSNPRRNTASFFNPSSNRVLIVPSGIPVCTEISR